MEEKNSSTESVIASSDGPTAIFLAGHNDKITIRQKTSNFKRKQKRKYVEKHLKAGAHTLDEVCVYIVTELGYREIEKSDSIYCEEYTQLRASFLQQYKPELLGEFAEVPQLESHDSKSLEEFWKKMHQRTKVAEEISKELFDIDLHMFEKLDEKGDFLLIIEKNYDYIGGSASGKKREMKKYNQEFKKVYRYYGVTQADIDNRTRRYDDVVRTLAYTP